MEKFWYEISPIAYFTGGLITIVMVDSTLGLVSGAVLITTSAVIMTLRHVYRTEKPAANRRRKAC